MRIVDGWWCPDLLSGPGNYLRRSADCDVATAMLPDDRKGLFIQAGGHVGTVPVRLLQTFAAGVTLEAHPDNFIALERNVVAMTHGELRCIRAGLGPHEGRARLDPNARNSGQHQVKLGRGTLAMLSVDSIMDQMPGRRLDALFLDIEGAEILALRGARRTLEEQAPAIVMVEENKRCRDYGFKPGDLAQELRPFGYHLAAEVGEDLVFAHASLGRQA